MADYTLWLCDQRGKHLMPLNNLRTFSAAKIVNGIGTFEAWLKTPSDLKTLQNYHYIENSIKKDFVVKLWMKSRGAPRLWNTYFVRGFGWEQGEGGGEVFGISGYDANYLLTSRVVAAYAGEVQSSMTDYADDILKAIVTDSLQDDAVPVPDYGTRAWSDLTVAGDLSQGPSITIEFSWEKLLTLQGGGVVKRICNTSREQGTDLFFAVVPDTVSGKAITYKFRTYTGQPGRDLTSGKNRVIFDADAGTLTNWRLWYDFSDETNYVYALGRGLEDDREVKQVYSASRIGASYWGRRESVAETNKDNADAVEADGYDALGEGRPKISLTGTPVSRPGQAFCRHYDVGDRVTAKAKGRSITSIVGSAVITLDEDGRTTEDVRLFEYE